MSGCYNFDRLIALPCSFAADEIHFNLMAVVSDRRMMCEKEITELESRKELAVQRVGDERN